MQPNDTADMASTANGEQPQLASQPPNGAEDTSISPSVPDPVTSPGAFLDYLKAFSIEDLSLAWEHLQDPPVQIASTGLYQESAISAWTDCMDILVVSHSHYIFIYSANIIYIPRDA